MIVAQLRIHDMESPLAALESFLPHPRSHSRTCVHVLHMALTSAICQIPPSVSGNP